jgi:hypothetical protein
MKELSASMGSVWERLLTRCPTKLYKSTNLGLKNPILVVVLAKKYHMAAPHGQTNNDAQWCVIVRLRSIAIAALQIGRSAPCKIDFRINHPELISCNEGLRRATNGNAWLKRHNFQVMHECVWKL